jgi:hypothetical protein
MNPPQKCCCGVHRFQESSRPAPMATAVVREDNEKSDVMGLHWPRAFMWPQRREGSWFRTREQAREEGGRAVVTAQVKSDPDADLVWVK